MKTIYKYEFDIDDRQELFLPRSAEIIHAGLDPNGTPCLWAIVNKHDQELKTVTLYIRGTGHPLPEVPLKHLATINQGPFMWHVFTNEQK